MAGTLRRLDAALVARHTAAINSNPFRTEQVKTWKRQISREVRTMDREIRQLEQAEKKIAKEIQATAKKG